METARGDGVLHAYTVIEVPQGHSALLRLLAQADREFLARYPELKGQRRDPLLPGIRFFLACRGTVAAGCCALQEGGVPSARRSYELKRMFVLPEARGTGAADALMISIETVALTVGAQLLCLETGLRQPEAIHVAHRHGYTHIAPYPPYLEDPFAQCFAKNL